MQSANTWARTVLKNKYHAEFTLYYKELRERQIITGLSRKQKRKLYSKADCLAATRLVAVHRDEYNILYRKARNTGFPHTSNWKCKAEREEANA